VSSVLVCAAAAQVYLAGAKGPAENLALLDHMLSARHQLGTLLGFESYAAFKAADATLAGAHRRWPYSNVGCMIIRMSVHQ